jgi:hypothetical protein
MDATSYLAARPASIRIDNVLVAASGFLATMVMTTVIYVLPLVGLAQVDLPVWIARVFARNAVVVGETSLVLHLLVGLAFAWLFARHIEPRLRLAPAAKGLLFGACLWLWAQAVAVPALGALATMMHSVEVAPGWVSRRLGLSSAISSLIAHLAYGLALSLVYGRPWNAPDGRPTRGWTERSLS